MVLAAGVVLVVALLSFLGAARFRNRLIKTELPKRLGVDIRQEANGVTYSHALGAHSQFKIHATKAEQLRTGLILLHEVEIELFGENGERIDRIEGHEFEYDEKSGTATAAGPVEITLMRPMVAPAIAPKATPDKAIDKKSLAKPIAKAAQEAASGEIHVKTSGITSNWHTGVTSTDQRVDFTLKQGAGSSTGAAFDSQKGVLVLSRNVEITAARNGDTVRIHSHHAEFARDELTCDLTAAMAEYRNGQATAVLAKVLFRQDGSAEKLDATGGFTVATRSGGKLNAPTGRLDFDEHSKPRHGHLEGGVHMDSATPDSQIHGSSPIAELEFTETGELRHAHLERGVDFSSEKKDRTEPAALSTSRHWRSPVVDIDFRDAGPGRVEPSRIHGIGGVKLNSETQRANAAPIPSQLAADDLTGSFGPDGTLAMLVGAGHASLAETSSNGVTQTANGDRIEAHFAPGSGSGAGKAPGQAEQIQTAVVDGHVVLLQDTSKKSAVKPQPPLRATAGKAVYESAGQWLHLTSSPRVDDGGMQLAADKIDISQESGDAFAHGNVKATWVNAASNSAPAPTGTTRDTFSIGGQGPAHAVANDVQIQRERQTATFSGKARIWQQDNSIAAPVIALNREQKTLVARSTNRSDPVRVVMLSASNLQQSASGVVGKSSTPSVIRVRGGQLTYSDADRKAVMTGTPLGQVVAETGTATSQSNQVELQLSAAGARTSGQGQVERMTSSGQVAVTTQGRSGTGEQLTYSGTSGEYVLTGTAAAPPRITDPARGAVTGQALIFHSRDDSVSIEGGEHEARTELTVRQDDGKREPQR
jgi:lipopolysaccharide export system protein LptA